MTTEPLAIRWLGLGLVLFVALLGAAGVVFALGLAGRVLWLVVLDVAR